jgi:hypothetical protein
MLKHWVYPHFFSFAGQKEEGSAKAAQAEVVAQALEIEQKVATLQVLAAQVEDLQCQQAAQESLHAAQFSDQEQAAKLHVATVQRLNAELAEKSNALLELQHSVQVVFIILLLTVLKLAVCRVFCVWGGETGLGERTTRANARRNGAQNSPDHHPGTLGAAHTKLATARCGPLVCAATKGSSHFRPRK